MERFKRILAVVEPHLEHTIAVERAAKVAQENQAEVVLLSVFQPLPASLIHVLPGGGRDWEERGYEEMRANLESASETLKARGIPTTIAVRTGNTPIEIIREVLQHGHDVVIKDAHTNAADTDSAISSVDLRLLRKCPCPVWLLKRGVGGAARRIMAAVDTSFADEEARALSENIIELAADLAKLEGAEFHIVHAWAEQGATFWARRMSVDEFDAFFEAAARKNRERFDAFLAKFNKQVADPTVHMESGEPEAVIPDCVDRLEIDLLVMGTVARSGLSGVLMGNTAERVLRRVPCNVLAIKPPGFKSPVLA